MSAINPTTFRQFAYTTVEENDAGDQIKDVQMKLENDPNARAQYLSESNEALNNLETDVNSNQNPEATHAELLQMEQDMDYFLKNMQGMESTDPEFMKDLEASRDRARDLRLQVEKNNPALFPQGN